MKADLVNPFVLAAADVLRSEVGADVRRGPMKVEKAGYVSDDVTVLVSLVGQVEGSVLYGMSYETAKGIVSQILGQPFERFDELAQSGISEVANVITGLSSTKLSEAGYVSIISVPMLIIGKGARISTLKIDRLVIPLETTLGELKLSLGLRFNPEAPKEVHRYTADVAALTL